MARTPQQLQTDAKELYLQIEKTLAFYNKVSCQCAFPRFRQYVSIDCSDTGNSFYLTEAEAFIARSKMNFHVQQMNAEKSGECYLDLWTCNKCGSQFEYGWSDFSIHISRSYLKLKNKTVEDIGAGPRNPIPVFVGPFGHSYPENVFLKTDLPALKDYLEEIKRI